MGMPHTTVRFSSQSGFIGDRIVNSSHMALPFFIYLAQKTINSSQYHLTPRVSHLAVLCLNFFICQMTIIMNTYPTRLV